MSDTTPTTKPQKIGGECASEFEVAAASAPPTLQFDAAIWASHVAEFDLTEEQKLALLRSVWDLMVMCADVGIGIEATQLACGKLQENQSETPTDSASGVDSKQSFQSDTFEYKEDA